MIQLTMATLAMPRGFHKNYGIAGFQTLFMPEETRAPYAQRVKAAMEHRWSDWAGHASASLSDVAMELAKEYGIDPTDKKAVGRVANNISTYLTQYKGDPTRWLPPIVKFFEISEDYLKSGNLSDLKPWARSRDAETGRHSSANEGETSGIVFRYKRVLALQGGSASLFTTVDNMDLEDLDEEADRIYLEVSDTSLMPSVEPGEVIVFKRTKLARLKRSLLIQSKKEPTLRSIRVLDPTGFSGEGAFIDPHNPEKNPPLCQSEWSVIAIALGKVAPDGIQL